MLTCTINPSNRRTTHSARGKQGPLGSWWGRPSQAQYYLPRCGKGQKRQTPRGAYHRADMTAQRKARLMPHWTSPITRLLSSQKLSLPGCPSIITRRLTPAWLSSPICPDSASETHKLCVQGLLQRLPFTFCETSEDTTSMTSPPLSPCSLPCTTCQAFPR